MTRCHSYAVAFSHVYACDEASGGCGTEYGRHSASIDTAARACGRCGGRLALQARSRADGTPVAPRTPTAFASFVGAHFAATRRAAPPGATHGDIMRGLAARWREARDGAGEAAGEGGGGGGADALAGGLRGLALGGA